MEAWQHWVVGATGWGLAAVGALVFLWAVMWDRLRGGHRRRRCPKCWYEMVGVPGAVCPECGKDAKRERRLLKTRRRWGWVCAAGLLVVVGMGGRTAVRTVHEWPEGAPTWVLIAALPWVETSKFPEQPGRTDLSDIAFMPVRISPIGLSPRKPAHAELMSRMSARQLYGWEYRILLWMCDRGDKTRTKHSPEWAEHYIPFVWMMHMHSLEEGHSMGEGLVLRTRRLFVSAGLEARRHSDSSNAWVVTRTSHLEGSRLWVRMAGAGDEDWHEIGAAGLPWSDGYVGPLLAGVGPLELDVRSLYQSRKGTEEWRVRVPVRTGADVEVQGVESPEMTSALRDSLNAGITLPRDGGRESPLWLAIDGTGRPLVGPGGSVGVVLHEDPGLTLAARFAVVCDGRLVAEGEAWWRRAYLRVWSEWSGEVIKLRMVPGHEAVSPEGEWRMRVVSDRALAERAGATRYWVGRVEVPLRVNVNEPPWVVEDREALQ